MTDDARAKTKANSVLTLSRQQPAANRDLNTTFNKNDEQRSRVVSPWCREKTGRRSEELLGDSDGDSKASSRISTRRKRIMSMGSQARTPMKIASPMVQKSTQTQRRRWAVGKRKPSKYNWTGTFERPKKSSSLRFDVEDRSLGEDNLSFSNIKDSTYDLNRDDSQNEKPETRTKIVCLKNSPEKIDNRDCRPCVNICGNANERRDDSSRREEKRESPCRVLLYKRNISSSPEGILRESRSQNDDFSNNLDIERDIPEEKSNLASLSALKAASDTNKRWPDVETVNAKENNVVDCKRQAGLVARVFHSKTCNLVFCLLKNIIQFLFLPTVYVAFFVYVQDEKESTVRGQSI